MVLPFFTSIIVRTYAWMVLLGRNGVVNQYLAALGLTERPLPLLYNQAGVLIGMSYVLLPFMVLTLYSVMSGIDPGLVRAAHSLGAERFQAFRRVFLPLSLPGVAGGTLLVFILSLGFFITPPSWEAPRTSMIAMLIEREVEFTLNWSFASALAVILLGHDARRLRAVQPVGAARPHLPGRRVIAGEGSGSGPGRSRCWPWRAAAVLVFLSRPSHHRYLSLRAGPTT